MKKVVFIKKNGAATMHVRKQEYRPEAYPRTIRIEQTSKPIKLAMLVGQLLLIAGIIGACTQRVPSNIALFVLVALTGLVVAIVAKVAKWWHHD